MVHRRTLVGERWQTPPISFTFCAPWWTKGGKCGLKITFLAPCPARCKEGENGHQYKMKKDNCSMYVHLYAASKIQLHN